MARISGTTSGRAGPNKEPVDISALNATGLDRNQEQADAYEDKKKAIQEATIKVFDARLHAERDDRAGTGGRSGVG